jgi:hypothetical protein
MRERKLWSELLKKADTRRHVLLLRFTQGIPPRVELLGEFNNPSHGDIT